jgi:hypothetical protein
VLDALAGQLDQRARQRKADADRAKAHDPRGCVDCGTTLSWRKPGLGGWHPTGDGPRCQSCYEARGGDAGGDDRDARIQAARLVLGNHPAPAWAGHGSEPAARYWLDDYLADAFRWFREVPDARPSEQRFGYVTAAELVARLYEGREPRPPVLRSRGRRHRCPACGAKGEVWTVEQVAVTAPTTSDGEVSRSIRAHFKVTWTCWRCRHVDVEQLAEQLPGVPVAGLAGG